MRKIRYALSVALLGIMLYGCQMIFFPENQTETPGQENQEEKGNEPEPEVDPVLNVKTLGMYNIDGVDYAYKRGEWQISRKYSADGKSVTFGLLDPANRVVYTVSGIKPAVSQISHSIYVTFTAQTPEKEIKTVSSTAKVLKVSGDTLWLKTSQGPYYVVKK